MTGLVRKATLLGVCGLVAASTALAAVPDPSKSTCPLGVVGDATQAWLRLAGTSGGVPSAWGTHTVTVRDFNNNVIAGSFVQINLNPSRCVDTRLCSVMIAGQTIDCPNYEVTGFTNGVGQFTFTLLGAGRNTGSTTSPAAHNPPATTVPCAEIRADGVLLCTAKVNAIDQNGALAGQNGVTGTDNSLVLGSQLAVAAGAPYKPLFDINRDGLVTGTDNSVELGQQLLGHSAGGCPGASYCP